MIDTVVDAAAAMAWCLPDEQHSDYGMALIRAASAGKILFPQNGFIEVANSLISAERQGRISPSESDRQWLELQALPIEIHEVDLRSAIDVARRFDLTVYDACYLRLAITTGARLATFDKDMIRAAKRAGVPLFSVK